MNTTLRSALLAIVAMLHGTGRAAVARGEETMAHEREVQQAAISKAKVYLEKHDAKSVAPIVKDAFDKWRAATTREEKEQRSRLVEDLVGQCFSYGDKEAEKFGREYAFQALQHSDDMTNRVEFGLVVYVVCDLRYQHYRKDFSQDAHVRSDVTRFCAHALGRFSAGFDPTWNAAAIRERNKIFTGHDAKRRKAAYEEESSLLMRRDIEQQYLRRFKDLYLPNIERNLAIFYSQPPAASEELEKCLLDHGVDEEITARILTAVRTIQK